MDDFEVYIQSNRDQFKEAPLNKDLLWQKIEQRLEHEEKPKVFTLNPLLKIAAIAILFVGLGFLTYQMNFNKISNNKYTSEIVEIKAHYNHLIHLKIAQIENAQPLTKNEKNTYLQLIDDLDKDANDLQTELQQNINNTTNSLLAHHRLTEEITKVFSVSEKPTLIIDNKHGKVDCRIWEKDSIKIVVEIEVEGRDEHQVEDLMDNISPRFSIFNDVVDVETDISKSNKNLFERFMDAVDIFDKHDIDVDYTVWAPVQTTLDIKNKFGDVLLENFTEPIRIEVGYGDFRTDSISANSELDLKFGKLIVRHIEQAEMNLKHYTAKIRTANDLQLKSSGSDIQIKKLLTLNVESNKDDLEIDTLGTIRGNAKLSDFILNYVYDSTWLELQNVALEIDAVHPSFNNLEIEQTGSHIDVNIKGTAFKLKVDLEGSQMSVPKTVYKIAKDVIDEKKNHRRVNLIYGDKPMQTVVLRGKNGSFNLFDF